MTKWLIERFDTLKEQTMSKYDELLQHATAPGNKLEVFDNGWGLITGPRWVQGLWVSRAIIAKWKEEGWL